ncbi:tetratricopeptide repeat protein [Actinoplanes sp. LDG1-06]|uniref:Tetratricopeptide repeat protein n=1 Tax=Paractinoplanes ovalisporus TaxID=2810368 RepID=A0ABS2APW4_9ACTN|nr:BTAD domain-containing putative transcriptional regulator [Actinoplanes ovalisporus]MBM2621820.1 tetratricopeptide repeat protein [Actinoplanes ovalisporus]
MEIGALGPLDVPAGPAGPPKQRAVLALLLCRANTAVPFHEVVEELWEHDPPASAAANIRQYVSGIKRLLPGVTRRGTGYLLTIDPRSLDVWWFQQGAEAARSLIADGELAAAIPVLDSALGLWRGPAVADVPAGPVLTGWRRALAEQRYVTCEDRAEAFLGLRAYDRAATQAHDLLALEPLRERAHLLLARARYGAGDVAGALAVLDTARRLLADELGLDPGDDLVALRQAILHREADPATLPPVRPQPATAQRRAPRQLPGEVSPFRGRAAQLAELDRLFRGTGSNRMVVVTLTGTAGVGKTTLALHWAHRVRGWFPDGQLYLNLRGFDPGGEPVDPAEALRTLLTALHVPAARIPATLDDRSALLRSTLTGTRTLLVLDNARDSDQVRPLLPGSPECLVVVTSRTALLGLVTAGAEPVRLEPVDPSEAADLLAARVGAERVAAEPGAVAEIARLSAYLPLTLAIVAAQAALSARQSLASLAASLGGLAASGGGSSSPGGLAAFSGGPSSPGGLAAFSGGEVDVRSVFSWSYRALGPDAARMFRLLGLHPGADVSVDAAAALASCPPKVAEDLLDELCAAALLHRTGSGRFATHDLLREYAAELAVSAAEPSAADSAALSVADDAGAAVARLYQHLLHTAYAAALAITTGRAPLDPPLEAPPGIPVTHLPGHAAASSWLEAEEATLLVVIDRAFAAGHDTLVWQLAWTLADHLDRRGRWDAWSRCAAAAADAARRSHAGPAVEADALRFLARARTQLGHPGAEEAYQRAMALFAEVGDLAGEARACLSYGRLLSAADRWAEAMVTDQRALHLMREAGHDRGVAAALNSVGWNHAQLGDYRSAIAFCTEAAELSEEVDHPMGLAAALDSLGYAHHHLGNHNEAVALYTRALQTYEQLGDRYYEAEVRTHLGDTHAAAGRPDEARAAWQSAWKILTALDHPDADELTARLTPPADDA